MCPNTHPGAGIRTGSRMPPGNPKKLQGGSKHPRGTAALQWGRGHPHPATLPSRSPFSAGLMLRCQQLLPDPRHPAASHGCSQPQEGEGMARL